MKVRPDLMVPYLLNARGYTSMLRGVPLSEENLEYAKDLATDVLGVSRSGMFVKYRGPRTRSSYHTLKKDAHSFDLYTRNF